MRSQPSKLIDRAGELEAIRRRLLGEGGEGADAARLLTLTGPAGVGKTRLALAAGGCFVDQFPDGVALVDLAPVRDPQLVPATIARALELVEIGRQTLPEQLQNYLRERQMLLLLDNFEQVLAAAGALADLLVSCPGLALLVTSRVPLQLRWEQVLRVPPLRVPDLTATLPPVQELARVPAVALFVERAKARSADFALTEAEASLVARLVAELDGLPLALELAAARLGGLPLPTIARRLGGRLRLLRWDAPDLPPRQRSLETAVGWSYDLLGEHEQRLFRCLAVFAGRAALGAIVAVARAIEAQHPADADAAEHMAEDEGSTLEALAALVEHSLVLPVPSDGRNGDGSAEDDEAKPAFALMETVREFAWELLARNGELATARRAHARYFLALAECANPRLRSHGQRAWYLRLEREFDNLHTALHWLFDHEVPAEREGGLRLAGALGWFWLMRGYHAEGLRWLDKALTRVPQTDPADAALGAARAQALLGLGPLLAQREDFESAKAALEEALSLACQQGTDAVALARALTYLGGRAMVSKEWAESTRLLHEALGLWEEIGDDHFIGMTLFLLGAVALGQGNDSEAAMIETTALERFEAAGDLRMAGRAHFTLAAIERARGNLSRAACHLHIGLQVGVDLRDRPLITLGTRATVSLTSVTGQWTDPAWAARLLGAAEALGQITGATLAAWECRRADQDVEGLRERLEQDGWSAAFREGRSLPFEQIAALALASLEEFTQSLAAREAATPARGNGADYTRTPGAPPAQQDDALEALTERERDVLGLLAAGCSNAEIADALVVAMGTVKAHVQHIYRKLAAHSRTQALARARSLGLLD